MRLPQKTRILLLATGLLLLCILGVWLFGGSKKPAFSITYLDAVDGRGHWKLRFAMTNTGNCTLFMSTAVRIEMQDSTSPMSVVATAPPGGLAPREVHVGYAVLSEPEMKQLEGSKWRYTCFAATDGLRARIYRWQWGPKGPGPRANRFIPNKLKGMPMTVKGTGDWVEFEKQSR
jgi:hypothetical protein